MLHSLLGLFLTLLCLTVTVRGDNASNYSSEIAQEMVYFSAAAYCQDAGQTNVTDWNCKACQLVPSFQVYSVADDPETNTFAYSGYYSQYDAIVVAFRGTEPKSWKNWVTNLDIAELAPYKDDPSAKVCKGFYDAWLGVEANITSDVQHLLQLHPAASLWITGHSLGAALSTLSAQHFVDLGYGESIIHYSFGSPRVGNKDFALFQMGNLTHSFRVTHWRDLIPHAPTTMQGYHHIATEVFYNEASTNYTVCSGTGEDPSCSDQFWFDYSIADHTVYLGFHLSDSC